MRNRSHDPDPRAILTHSQSRKTRPSTSENFLRLIHFHGRESSEIFFCVHSHNFGSIIFVPQTKIKFDSDEDEALDKYPLHKSLGVWKEECLHFRDLAEFQHVRTKQPTNRIFPPVEKEAAPLPM